MKKSIRLITILYSYHVIRHLLKIFLTMEEEIILILVQCPDLWHQAGLCQSSQVPLEQQTVLFME